jgi:hypothetical protein
MLPNAPQEDHDRQDKQLPAAAHVAKARQRIGLLPQRSLGTRTRLGKRLGDHHGDIDEGYGSDGAAECIIGIRSILLLNDKAKEWACYEACGKHGGYLAARAKLRIQRVLIRAAYLAKGQAALLHCCDVCHVGKDDGKRHGQEPGDRIHDHIGP